LQGQDDGHEFGQDADKDEALRARLQSLSHALNAQSTDAESAQTDEKRVEKAQRSMSLAMSLGFRVLTEFVAAVIVGGAIGWQFDKWFGTSPILLIVFLGFGVAAAFWNVYRMASPKGSRDRLL